MPGQSVREELDRVVNEGIAAYIFYPIGFWGLVNWESPERGSVPQSIGGTLIVAASVVTMICAFRIFQLRRDIRNLTQADKAERHVSDLLRRLRDKNYVTFDDLVDKTGGFTTNIDHVVVGPGGVFAVETKAFSVFGNGRAQINSEGALLLSKKVAFGDPLSKRENRPTKSRVIWSRCFDASCWLMQS